MARDAEAPASKDQERKDMINFKTIADTSIYSIEKSVSQYKYIIQSKVVSVIETASSEFRNAKACEDLEEIQAKMEHGSSTRQFQREHASEGSGGFVSGSSDGSDQSLNPITRKQRNRQHKR
ncbi:hypothetical protein QQ045_006929 [Rhodiola kirilowii]